MRLIWSTSFSLRLSMMSCVGMVNDYPLQASFHRSSSRRGGRHAGRFPVLTRPYLPIGCPAWWPEYVEPILRFHHALFSPNQRRNQSYAEEVAGSHWY